MNAYGVEDREIHLEPSTEFRFEVEGKNEIATVMLISGTSEIFGSELVIGTTYTFESGTSLAIFTWSGCTLIFRGRNNNGYVAHHYLMRFYITNIHMKLEEMRERSDVNLSLRGPVTMIVGPKDVGKTTLSKILLNYAIRMGRTPIFVDLNVTEGTVSIPGTIGAALVYKTAPGNEFKRVVPLAFHYGHIMPSENAELFKHLVTCMAKAVKKIAEKNVMVNASGIIIKTCGWITGEGYDHLIHIAQVFQAKTIVVLEHDKLFYQIIKDLPRFVRVVNTLAIEGVVSKSPESRANYQERQIKKYFYGSKFPQHAHKIDLKFSNIFIYKIGASDILESCLPVLVRPSHELLHHLLAVSYAHTFEDVINKSVAGYVCIIEVDVKNEKLTVLSPWERQIPNSLFILSDVTFIDE